MQREKHDPDFFGTPNGTNHALFDMIVVVPLMAFVWHHYHYIPYLVGIWIGSVAFWIGLEMWQNWKGIKVGWEKNKCWWCIWRWNKSRHHDWIMPALAPFSLLFIAFGTMLWGDGTKQLRKIQKHKFLKTGKG